ncbi:MAG: hypothetical protein CVU17_07165 [Betaproteobacteria bacterium HGW-Betaproteobacteria-11]|nr:MAG: hypothetical protein CVU17_07165 [Betaproteobacteria bacterium HGW-Betaproteobacteria-11]
MKNHESAIFCLANTLRKAGFCLLFGLLPATVALAEAKKLTEIEQDVCTTWMGTKMLHMSIFQPEKPKDEYCREVTDPGDAFVVIDLLDKELRESPVGIVIKNAAVAENNILVSEPPAHHPNGIVTLPVHLEKGIYSVEIRKEGSTPEEIVYRVRVNLIDYSRYLFPVLLAALAIFLAQRIYRRRYLQNAIARLRARSGRK